jgi:hypothetical protein
MEKFSYVIVLFATVLAVIILAVGGQGQTVIDAFKIILYAVVATVVLSCLIWLVTMAANHILRWRESRAATRRAERNAQYSVVTAKAGDQVYLHDTDHSARWRAAHRDPRIYADGEWSPPDKDEWGSYILWLESHARGRRGALPGPGVPPMLDAGQPPELMTELRAGYNNLLVVGKDGSGKTTLLQHLIGGWEGEAYVIDPHDDRHTWPGNAQIVGGGLDWVSISKFLYWFQEEVKRRYQERATGSQPTFTPLLVAMDEWTDIVEYADGAAESMRAGLTGNRKVNTCMAVGSHGEHVKVLGLEGRSSLRKCFYVVRMHGDHRTGIAATLDVGDGELPVILPGPYAQLAGAEPARMLDVSGVELPATDQEREILAMWDGGEHSLSRIGARVYGSRGGWQSERIEDVLKKHGRL